MSHFIEEIFELLFEYAFQGFFGHTGRLVIKALTFGQVNLDLDRWAHSFLAVVVGLIFWAAVLGVFAWWKYPQFIPG